MPVVTPTTLYRIGGISLLLGGLVGPVGHLVLHPPSHALIYQGGPRWVIAHAVMTLADVLILFGMFAFYARFHRRLGVLGLVGFPLVCGLLLYMVLNFGYEATTLPMIKAAFPGEIATDPAGDLSGPFYHGLFPVPILCAAGLVLFGVAIFRAGGGLRWAGVALAASVFIEFAAIIVVHQLPAWEYLLPVAELDQPSSLRLARPRHADGGRSAACTGPARTFAGLSALMTGRRATTGRAGTGSQVGQGLYWWAVFSRSRHRRGPSRTGGHARSPSIGLPPAACPGCRRRCCSPSWG